MVLDNIFGFIDPKNMVFIEQSNAVFDSSMSNFLSKIPYTKTSGKIERYGDLFIGIQNNESYRIKVYFYEVIINNIFDVCEPLHLTPGEIGILKQPLNLITKRAKNLYYKIEKEENIDSSKSNTDFIYGYVVESLRRKLRE
jgi:hypothetical protein